VIVIAEGAGESMRDSELPSLGTDASGNVKPGDVGLFMRDTLISEFKKRQIDLTLKYIDPTYMIRSVPANGFDSKLCSQLALSAVHGQMAGYT
jgi:6-phosphofructokinase 1